MRQTTGMMRLVNRGVAVVAVMVMACTMKVVGQDVPKDVSPLMQPLLEKAVLHMNNSRYDSAAVVLNRAFTQTDFQLSLLDLYYVHSLEAEIMYYNALFDQGLNIALRAHEVAVELHNDTLLGAADNLLGLLLMNVGRYDDALRHLRKAVRLIPRYHGNGFLSFNYQAIANIGECFLLLGQPDSVVAYSMQSLDEAEALGKQRGLGIAYWNLAEAYLLLNNLEQATKYARLGLQVVADSPHRDVIQILYASQMRIHENAGNRDSAYIYLALGLGENDNPLNTDYSRTDFMNVAIDLCLRYRDVGTATALISKLKDLERTLAAKEQGQRINVLRDYYEKNRDLMLTTERIEAQEKELVWRTRIQLALGALAIVLLSLIYFLYRAFRQRQRIQHLEFQRQMEQVNRQTEIKALQDRMQAVQEERNRIASDLHDDIGASLSSIRIYSDAADTQRLTRPEESARLITLIKDTSAAIMDRMSDIIWTISAKNDGGQNLVFKMKSYGGEVFGSIGIQPIYLLDGQVNDLRPSVHARKNIYLIYKEAVNNLAKYSGAKTATISISALGGVFRLAIKDDGVGFDTGTVVNGNGLVNMTQRAAALGGELTVHSELGKGTEISLRCAIARISDDAMPREAAPL